MRRVSRALAKVYLIRVQLITIRYISSLFYRLIIIVVNNTNCILIGLNSERYQRPIKLPNNYNYASIAKYMFHVRIECAGYIRYFQLSATCIAGDRPDA